MRKSTPPLSSAFTVKRQFFRCFYNTEEVGCGKAPHPTPASVGWVSEALPIAFSHPATSRWVTLRSPILRNVRFWEAPDRRSTTDLKRKPANPPQPSNPNFQPPMTEFPPNHGAARHKPKMSAAENRDPRTPQPPPQQIPRLPHDPSRPSIRNPCKIETGRRRPHHRSEHIPPRARKSPPAPS